MRVLLQRVACASVAVNGTTVAETGPGLLLLTGFGAADDASVLPAMADKVLGLRVFEDGNGRFQYSILDTGGDILAVPQFTLYGDTQRGRRPDFSGALDPGDAGLLFDRFSGILADRAPGKVERGRFGARMAVHLVNDGPVTLLIERDPR